MVATPYFRAKKINGDEYAEGCLNVWEQNEKVYYSIMEIGIYPNPFNNIHLIDPTTLAIHFPNMTDVKGDKIFASLQENGKGGDILFDMEYEYTVSFDGLKFNLQGLFSQSSFNEFDSWENFDIIGVEE